MTKLYSHCRNCGMQNYSSCSRERLGVDATPRLWLASGSVTAGYPRWLIVSLLIVAVGAHWTVLQSAAWVGMLASNLSTTSIREALTRTFDGKHPCKLCKVVHAGKSAEKRQDNQKPQTKLDLLLIGRPNIGFCWLREPFQLEAFSQLVSRIDTPPSPPPKTVLS